MDKSVELSIVMPCLDEERTIGTCIEKALTCTNRLGVKAEIVIADNGSADGSVEVAESFGARVVHITKRGYGAALQGGIEAAHGDIIIMGDADDSYDFAALDTFISELRDGADLVMGDRFAGGVDHNAMPPLHRYIGNPLLSFLGRLFFGASIRDFHCGLRGFSRRRIMALDLSCPGMEFASEMVIKASLAKYDIREVPTTLSPDGRDRPPHLRSFRDGWRHLQLLLLYSPRWLFLYPGLALLLVGMTSMILLVGGPVRIGQVEFDIHTLLYAAAAAILGIQMVFFGLLMRVAAAGLGRMPEALGVIRLLSWFTLERGLAAGLLAMFAGLAWTLVAVLEWGQVGFSVMDPRITMRTVIPSVTLLIIGFQTIMASFFLGALRLYRK